jgi:AcrR family transcriptional regulator
LETYCSDLETQASVLLGQRRYPRPVLTLPEHLRPVPVGTERLSREEIRDLRRERVLAAAAPVFARRGYGATTVDDLVGAAKIGVGSFYELFAGREDCFLRLYDTTVATARAELLDALPAGAEWPERFRAAMRRLLELAAADPDCARIVLVEASAAGPAARARHAATVEDAIAALGGARECRPDGPLPASFERATASGLAWVLGRHLAAGGPLPVEELLTEMSRIVLEPYPA